MGTQPVRRRLSRRVRRGPVRSFGLGRHDGTDVLAVSFSTPDLVGHAFGPRSLEVRDVYAQLDRTIGALLDRTRALVGRGNYVIGLTADHGVTPIPSQLQSEGKDAGRLVSTAIAALVEAQSNARAGAGKYSRGSTRTISISLLEWYARLTRSAAATAAVIKALTATPGIDRVFRSEELAGGASSSELTLRGAALGYFAGRSGDLIIAPKPGWMFGGRYDARLRQRRRPAGADPAVRPRRPERRISTVGFAGGYRADTGGAHRRRPAAGRGARPERGAARAGEERIGES